MNSAHGLMTKLSFSKKLTKLIPTFFFLRKTWHICNILELEQKMYKYTKIN